MMSPTEILVIALALAADAFAVSVATGVTACGARPPRQAFRLMWHFGLFQTLMTLLGWLAGATVRTWIDRFDHWVAAGMLAAVALHMIWEGIFGEEREATTDPSRGMSLIVLSVATSLDALAVGASLGMVRVAVWWPAVAIGVVAAALSGIGLAVGRSLTRVGPIRVGASVLGGVVLLGIAAKILIDHGVFG